MATRVKPLGQRYLIQPDAQSREVRGIARPDTSPDDRPQSGVVLGFGAEVLDPIEPGTRVLFPSWSGVEFTVDGERLMMLSPSEIAAELKEAERASAA